MSAFKQWTAGSMGLICLIGLTLVLVAGMQSAFGANGDGGGPQVVEEHAGEEDAALEMDNKWAVFAAVAFTVGIGCVSAGYAVAKVGAAALGAASEKPEIMGRALIFVGLAEGIAIYGLIVGLIMMGKI